MNVLERYQLHLFLWRLATVQLCTHVNGGNFVTENWETVLMFKYTSVKLCKWSNIGQYRDTNRVQMCAHCAMHSVHGCQLCNHCSVFFLLSFVQGLVQKYFV